MFHVFINLFNIHLNRSLKSSSCLHSACLKVKCVSFLHSSAFTTKGMETEKLHVTRSWNPCWCLPSLQDSECPKAQFANHKQVIKRLKARGKGHFAGPWGITWKNWMVSWGLRNAKARNLTTEERQRSVCNMDRGSGHLRCWKEDTVVRMWRAEARLAGSIDTGQAETVCTRQRLQRAAWVLIWPLLHMLGAESTQPHCYYFYNDDVSQLLNLFCTKIWILLNKLEHQAIVVPLLHAARELLSAYCMGESCSPHRLYCLVKVQAFST